MDTWKFYDITHREHVICNPTSEDALARLVELLRLPADARAVDIACGKGEFLIRLAEAYGARCTGIDISPYFIRAAEARFRARLPAASATFLGINGSDFIPQAPHSFSLASCIGADWIFGGHVGTLEALIRMVEPGGWVITGEPFWRQEPSASYLEASGEKSEDYGSHASNVEAGEKLGLDLVHTFVSGKQDWDRYEGLQWYATEAYARAHPDDPDLPEVALRVAKNKATYLRWGRDTIGWAIYVFRHRITQAAR
jgi:SAM-dependent methyltransferase